jgi:hypothetical protein
MQDKRVDVKLYSKYSHRTVHFTEIHFKLFQRKSVLAVATGMSNNNNAAFVFLKQK